jgi:putative oxidoreductase
VAQTSPQKLPYGSGNLGANVGVGLGPARFWTIIVGQAFQPARIEGQSQAPVGATGLRAGRIRFKKANHMKYLTLLARLLIGVIFVYASVYKIWAPTEFAVSIRNYMIIPVAWSNIIAVALPWIELGAGALLILGIFTRPAALLITGMLVVFLGAIIYAYSIGLDIDCGCFSSAASSQGRITPFNLVLDSTLVIISIFIVFADRGDYGILRLSRSAA